MPNAKSTAKVTPGQNTIVKAQSLTETKSITSHSASWNNEVEWSRKVGLGNGAGGLYQYTYFTGFINGRYGIAAQLSVPVFLLISRKYIRKCLNSLKRKAFFSFTCQKTCEIEYTLVPNAKGKSDLWKHFNLYKGKTRQPNWCWCCCLQTVQSCRQTCERHLKHVDAQRCHHPWSLLGSPLGNEQKAGMLVCISRYISILYQYGHKIPVRFLYQYTQLYLEAWNSEQQAKPAKPCLDLLRALNTELWTAVGYLRRGDLDICVCSWCSTLGPFGETEKGSFPPFNCVNWAIPKCIVNFARVIMSHWNLGKHLLCTTVLDNN